jgi:hypothetical protein
MPIRIYRPEEPAFGAPEWFGALGAPLILVARFVPLSRLPGWGCTFRALTGLPCPSCGMTRSFDWLARGRLLDALAVNPIGFALAAFSAVGLLYLLARPLRPPRLSFQLSPRASLALRIGIGAALALNWAFLLARALGSRA